MDKDQTIKQIIHNNIIKTLKVSAIIQQTHQEDLGHATL